MNLLSPEITGVAALPGLFLDTVLQVSYLFYYKTFTLFFVIELNVLGVYYLASLCQQVIIFLCYLLSKDLVKFLNQNYSR